MHKHTDELDLLKGSTNAGAGKFQELSTDNTKEATGEMKMNTCTEEPDELEGPATYKLDEMEIL